MTHRLCDLSVLKIAHKVLDLFSGHGVVIMWLAWNMNQSNKGNNNISDLLLSFATKPNQTKPYNDTLMCIYSFSQWSQILGINKTKKKVTTYCPRWPKGWGPRAGWRHISWTQPCEQVAISTTQCPGIGRTSSQVEEDEENVYIKIKTNWGINMMQCVKRN